MDPMDPSKMKNGHNPICPKSIILHVFKNYAVDWFVAETAEEASRMYREFVKNTGMGIDEDEMCLEFTQLDDSKTISILVDDTEGSKVNKTAAQWCVSNGKGFLCTENF